MRVARMCFLNRLTMDEGRRPAVDEKRKTTEQTSAGGDIQAGGHVSGTALGVEMKRRMYPNATDIFTIIGLLIVPMVITALAGVLLNRYSGLPAGACNAILYFVNMALAILFVAIHRRSRRAQALTLGLGIKSVNAPLILWGILLIVVVGIVIEPLLSLFPDAYLEQLNKAIGTGGWTILTTVLLAPVMEEVLFRGLIQGAICKRDGAVKGILLSALLFGAIHVVPQQAINAFFCGIVLGYIYLRTGSLLAVILLHALNNAISYIALELLGPDMAYLQTKELLGGGTVYYIVYGISVVFLVVSAVMMVRHLRSAAGEVPRQMENSGV